MDIGKLLERFGSKKIRPLTAIVIAEVMLFLFSIETLIEWFNISPKLFILFFILSCFFVFLIIHYIKQPEGERSWLNAFRKPKVFISTVLSIMFFGIIFIVYVACLPEYKVIAITGYRDGEFSKEPLKYFTKQANLDELSDEVQTLIGPQYRVKVDDNVDDTSKKSRLIIVPGIFDHEEAVETIMKLEERLNFFYSSNEENQIPTFGKLYRVIHKNKPDFIKIKKEILFVDSSDRNKESNWRRIWNNLKYILNI
jgi:acyl carrier protein